MFVHHSEQDHALLILTDEPRWMNTRGFHQPIFWGTTVDLQIYLYSNIENGSLDGIKVWGDIRYYGNIA